MSQRVTTVLTTFLKILTIRALRGLAAGRVRPSRRHLLRRHRRLEIAGVAFFAHALTPNNWGTPIVSAREGTTGAPIHPSAHNWRQTRPPAVGSATARLHAAESTSTDGGRDGTFYAQAITAPGVAASVTLASYAAAGAKWRRSSAEIGQNRKSESQIGSSNMVDRVSGGISSIRDRFRCRATAGRLQTDGYGLSPPSGLNPIARR